MFDRFYQEKRADTRELPSTVASAFSDTSRTKEHIVYLHI